VIATVSLLETLLEHFASRMARWPSRSPTHPA
jgi:hypothetical protein